MPVLQEVPGKDPKGFRKELPVRDHGFEWAKGVAEAKTARVAVEFPDYSW